MQVSSDFLKASKYSEAVLAVWTKESSHNYENNSRFHEDFVCPSAIKFVVEFDSRCRTERRCVPYSLYTDAYLPSPVGMTISSSQMPVDRNSSLMTQLAQSVGQG